MFKSYPNSKRLMYVGSISARSASGRTVWQDQMGCNLTDQIIVLTWLLRYIKLA